MTKFGKAWRMGVRSNLILTGLILGAFCPLFSFAAQSVGSTSQGFGAGTLGGEGQPLYSVTNLNDSGLGSLRDALSEGNRYIIFDVAGEILLQSRLYVQGANITIDGFTAPFPGITLKNYGPFIRGNMGAHDVVVRGIRVRNTFANRDGIQIASGAYNIVIDHVSIQGSGDGNLDITESHDVTISWSILAEPAGTEKNMLIKYNPSRITLHHNLFVHARQRNPQVRIDDAGTPATDTTVDFQNNVVWGWEGGYGTLIWHGPWANVVNNFYSSVGGDPNEALEVSNGAKAYVAGNLSLDGLTDQINGEGTEAGPFSAPHVDTTDACTAAHEVLAYAGVRPLDLVDQQYLSSISLPLCAGEDPSIAVNPGQVNFSAIQGEANPAPQLLTITDSNGDSLSWNVTDIGPSWLSVTPQNGTTPSELTVAVNSSDLPIGIHEGTFNVEAPSASNSPRTIFVSLTISSSGVPPPPPPPPPTDGPTITSPTPGSILPGSTVTFEWTTNGEKVKKWWLYVGSSQGGDDLYDSGKMSSQNLSRTVSGLPTDGRVIWVRLVFNTGSKQSADFQYTAAVQ